MLYAWMYVPIMAVPPRRAQAAGRGVGGRGSPSPPAPLPRGEGRIGRAWLPQQGLLIVQESRWVNGTRWGMNPPNPLNSGGCYGWQTFRIIYRERIVQRLPRIKRTPLPRGEGRIERALARWGQTLSHVADARGTPPAFAGAGSLPRGEGYVWGFQAGAWRVPP